MNLVLIGFMGTGKSALGKVLAGELGYEFIDTDHVIEAEYGKKITQIFAEEGEAFFRVLENKLARKLSKVQRKVIATGGGWVLNQENIALSRLNGFLIALIARPEIIYDRTKDEVHRPLLIGPDPLLKIGQILEEREGLYRKAADLVVDSTLGAPAALAFEIIRELTRRGIVHGRD